MSNAKMGPIWVPIRVLRSRVPVPLYTAPACARPCSRPVHRTNYSSSWMSKRQLFTKTLNISSKNLPETMKVDGDISGTTGPILPSFGQIGANIINFWKSHMQLGTRIFQDVIWFKTWDIPITGPIWDPFSVAKMQCLHIHEMGPKWDPFLHSSLMTYLA